MHQPLQQYGQQQPFPVQASGPIQGPPHQLPFTQQPMHTQSRPQGPTQSLHPSSAALPPPPPHSGVQAHGVPPHQSQTYPGRPVAPNQVAPAQSFPQSSGAFGVAAQPRPAQFGSVQPSGNQIYESRGANQQQVPSGQQFSQSDLAVQHAAGQEIGSASKKTPGNDVSGGGESLKYATGGKGADEESKITAKIDANGPDDEKGDDELSVKKMLKEGANGNLNPLSGGNAVEVADEKNGMAVTPKQAEYSSIEDSTSRRPEADLGHRKDDTNVSTQDRSHQLPLGTQGTSSHQQRLAAPAMLPPGPATGAAPTALLPGQNPAQLRPQGPGHYPPPRESIYPSEQYQQSGSSHDIPFGGPPFGWGNGQSGNTHGNYEHPPGAQRGQLYQNNPPYSQAAFPRTSDAEPLGGAPHGHDGSQRPIEAAMFQNQRLHHIEGRYPDPHVSGPFERGQHGQPTADESNVPRMNRPPGFDAAPGMHVKNVSDHRNPFSVGPGGHLDQGEYEEAPKQLPKPLHMGVEPSSKFGNGFSSSRAGDYPPREFNYDNPSRFLPPYHRSAPFLPNDAGERPPTGFHDDHTGRGDASRTQSDFFGSGPGFGMDRFPPRSPGREYHGVPSRGFGGPSGELHGQSGHDDSHVRDTRTFHEGSRPFDISSNPAGKPFGEHFRNGDMVGQDFMPNQLRRGELFGPRNVQSQMRLGDGFGTFPDPRMGELAGPGSFPPSESFGGNKSNNPRLGEPGFRSSYSLHGFPTDGGFYAGNLEFDRFRTRMPTSMGWCRICKVDCDTVEGLELHSQTREHQRMTMDMVISIKQQNAKRQKTSKDHPIAEEGSRSRNFGNRGRAKKA